MKKQQNGRGFWAYFFVFTAVYFSMDTLQFGTNKAEIYSTILYVSVPALAVIAFIYGALNRKQVHAISLLMAVTLCVMSIATHLATESQLNLKYFFEVMVILQAYLICTVVSVEDFKRAFTNIMAVLAIISVAGFALRYIYPGIVNHIPVLTNLSDMQYGNLLLTTIPHDVMYVTFRNYGIFREPGVYQFFLNLALIFLLEKPNTFKSWQMYALLLAMVFTFSTAGYIIVIAILLVYFFMDRLQIKASTVLPMLIGVLVVGSLFSQGIIKADNALFSKLLTSNSSTNSRFGSIAVDFHIAKMGPVFGCGFEFVENNFEIIALDEFALTGMHNTNTIMKMMAVHGFAMAFLFVLGIGLFCRKHLIRRGWTLFFVVFAALFSAADLIFNTIVYVVVLYGFIPSQTVESNDEPDSD